MKNNLETYMNDPDIINEPMPLREIHAIRLMIYDDIEEMTPEEHITYINKQTDPLIKQYGLQYLLVKSLE
jgi:hypothetical protein